VAGPVRIFISAGEASGDLYGALLIEALRQRLGEVDFLGCGGDRMRAAGCRTLVDAHRIAMVGIVEVVPGLARAWSAFRRLVKAIRTERPALAVLIDFPDFNLRLAKRLRRRGVPVLYFVAPQVWAWRGWRLRTIRKNVNRLLCIFPFEEPFFVKAGVAADFVGHPLAGRVAPSLTAEEFRRRNALPEDRPLIALLPGSREKEILLNLPPMLESARRFGAERPCSFVLPAASTTSVEWIRKQVASSGVPLTVVENSAYDAVAHAQAAIVASGTAAVEAALLGTPMVIVYRVSKATWRLGRWMVRTPFFSMVNLVAERRIVPEFIQDQFQPEAVARAVRQLVEDPAAGEKMRQQLKDVAGRLSRAPESARPQSGDAIQRAAAIAESMISGRIAP
jgi:lipid-A-disaccharide synthase